MNRFAAILPSLAVMCVVLGLLNFFAFMATSSRAGGSALSGTVRANHYYLNYKGTLIEVSPIVWQRQRIHELSLLITHPLMLLSMGYLARRSIAGQIFRVSSATVAQTVAAIRSSGALVHAISCAGRIGTVRASDQLIHVELYPGGLVVQMSTLAPFGVSVADVLTLAVEESWGGRVILISHRSRQIPSPIQLRCAHEPNFCAAMEQIMRPAHRRTAP